MFVKLKTTEVQMELCIPDSRTGYYRGTRFDWAGIFRTVTCGNAVYSEEWFEDYDPLRHDCVCGPVDEFSQVGYENALPGDSFLKIGVGLLKRPDYANYDRFRLYEIVREGTRTIEHTKTSAKFRHFLMGEKYGYDYEKEISLSKKEKAFSIECRMINLGPEIIDTSVYNHNFWTLGQRCVGPDTMIDFPFRPSGKWREGGCGKAFLTETGIRFSDRLENGESVFIGDLRIEAESGRGYGFSAANAKTGCRVEAECSMQMDHAVFWANSQVACVEPYIKIRLFPGESAEWNIKYTLF